MKYKTKAEPTRHILDPRFQYIPARSTDLRETFRRAREELRKDPALAEAAEQSVVYMRQRATR